MEPYAFWCRRCERSHAGECPPKKVWPPGYVIEANPLPPASLLSAGENDYKPDGWWASNDKKVWGRTTQSAAMQYPVFEYWVNGKCQSSGLSSGWGAQVWPPPPAVTT